MCTFPKKGQRVARNKIGGTYLTYPYAACLLGRCVESPRMSQSDSEQGEPLQASDHGRCPAHDFAGSSE